MVVQVESPIVDRLFTSHSDEDLKALFEPIIKNLLHLDHAEWRLQLTTDGFDSAQVELLESIVREWTGHIDKDDLYERLMAVQSIEDDAEREQVVVQWLGGISTGAVGDAIRQAGFPMPLDAVCYALGQLNRVINGAVEFEVMRREAVEQPTGGWSMTPEQIEAGIELAERGFVEDVKTWPNY